MKVKTTKLNRGEQRYQEMYNESNDYSLAHAYGTYSRAKADAWRYCENKCREYDGEV